MRNVVILILFTIPFLLYSRDVKLDYGYGGGFNYQYNYHNGSFSKLNEIPNCCPEFTKGDGKGFAAFFFYEMPVINNFRGQLRLTYSNFNAMFKYTEFTMVNLDNEAVSGEFTHTLEADLSGLVLQPILSYEIIENFNINAGLNAGYLLSGSFYQIEKITKPSDQATYIKDGVDTELREWNEAEGDIPKIISFQLGVLGGMSYDLQLNSQRTMWLSPELYYTLGFSDIAEKTPWTVNSLFLGISFKYRPNPPLKIISPSEELPIKTGEILADEIEMTGNQNDIIFGEFSIPELKVTEPKVNLNATITARGVDGGQEFKEATMVVEEFLSTNMRPLLNYIFFDNNSSDLPDRYIKLDAKKVEKFSSSDLCNITTMRTYYDVLNILGLRLKENPETKINLTGCNSGKESGGNSLSQNRADVIKSYLSGIWKIPSSRITTTARNLPEIPSNQNDLDGIAENRRVEIKSDSWEIMKPVVTEDTLRKVSPPLIRFYIETKSENTISSWKVTAMQNGDILKTIEGKDSVPGVLEWFIDREKESVPNFSAPIEYMIEINDNKGNQFMSETGLLPTEMITLQKKKENRVGDKRIDRYSLILFDYSSVELSNENNKIVDFIKGNLQSDSRLLISGFSDRIGNDEFNFKLSKERAEKVSIALERPNAFTRGVGESMLIYNNDFPEGRFYCRTVEIEVETPMSWNK